MNVYGQGGSRSEGIGSFEFDLGTGRFAKFLRT